jgi:hypothetical protein
MTTNKEAITRDLKQEMEFMLKQREQEENEKKA